MRRPTDPAEFPVWKYSGIADGRQPAAHAVHFGHFYPSSAKFDGVRDSVAGYFDGFNRRCPFIPVDKWELEELKAAGIRLR